MTEKSLRDRFSDLEKRIDALEASGQEVTPEDHDAGGLIDHLRGKRYRLRSYFGDADGDADVGATAAASKAEDGGIASPADAEHEVRDMERAVDAVDQARAPGH
jgi:hypothetical protein